MCDIQLPSHLPALSVGDGQDNVPTDEGRGVLAELSIHLHSWLCLHADEYLGNRSDVRFFPSNLRFWILTWRV